MIHKQDYLKVARVLCTNQHNEALEKKKLRTRPNKKKKRIKTVHRPTLSEKASASRCPASSLVPDLVICAISLFGVVYDLDHSQKTLL
jgi:hypothetical protein